MVKVCKLFPARGVYFEIVSRIASERVEIGADIYEDIVERILRNIDADVRRHGRPRELHLADIHRVAVRHGQKLRRIQQRFVRRFDEKICLRRIRHHHIYGVAVYLHHDLIVVEVKIAALVQAYLRRKTVYGGICFAVGIAVFEKQVRSVGEINLAIHPEKIDVVRAIHIDVGFVPFHNPTDVVIFIKQHQESGTVVL